MNISDRTSQRYERSTEYLDDRTNSVHLLSFETNVGNKSEWYIHLRMASILFEEMFRDYGMKDNAYRSEMLLKNVDKPSMFDGAELGFSVWNSDQAALQFFAALLIHADIFSMFL